MAVQVTVTTMVVGEVEVEVELASASFGYLGSVDLPEPPATEWADRVLEPESSMLAPGLSLQLA